MYCTKCGKEIPDGAYACAYCGAVVVKIENSAPKMPLIDNDPDPAVKPVADETVIETENSVTESVGTPDATPAEPSPRLWAANPAPGAPTYGQQPGYGYTPAPSYVPQYRDPGAVQPQAPAKSRMNILSIIAFAVSFITGLVGLILSIISLSGHRNSPELRGKGFAVAALIISIVNIFMFFLGILSGLIS